MFVCIRSSLRSVRFHQLLRCAHKHIVNIMKVYIEMNIIQVEIIRLRKNSEFIAFGNFEVEIIILSRPTCSLLSVPTVLFRGRRTFRHMTTSVHAISVHVQFVHSHVGTCPIRNIVTSGHVISGQRRFGTAQLHYFKLLYMYVPCANSALIRYYLPRL